MKQKFWRLAARLSVAMSLGILVLMVLDERNPVMGFLTAPQAKVYLLIAVVWSVITGILTLNHTGSR